MLTMLARACMCWIVYYSLFRYQKEMVGYKAKKAAEASEDESESD